MDTKNLNLADGCGCCGDACASRGSCRHADENPPPPGSACYSDPCAADPECLLPSGEPCMLPACRRASAATGAAA